MRLEIVEEDATRMDVDVLALKYAQARYGLDSYVYERLLESGQKKERMSPAPGEYQVVPGAPPLAPRNLLFVGTEPLWALGYLEIRLLARTILSAVGEALPRTKTLALTVHGANYGLDEGEVFDSMIAGFVDAVEGGEELNALASVSFVERDRRRADRLRKLLWELLPDRVLERGQRPTKNKGAQERLRSVGYASAAKSHVFVAMPFSEDFDDVYHYAIQGAAKKAGLLCERADVTAFTGDILARVQERVRNASLLVADLSTSNPNVYLEVGYAWGRDVPCVLLVRDASELKFDVRGQRCLVYKKIKELEEKLNQELDGLLQAAGGRSV